MNFKERYEQWGTFHNVILMEDYEVAKWILCKDPTMIDMFNGTSEDLLESHPVMYAWLNESGLYPTYFTPLLS